MTWLASRGKGRLGMYSSMVCTIWHHSTHQAHHVSCPTSHMLEIAMLFMLVDPCWYMVDVFAAVVVKLRWRLSCARCCDEG